MPRREPRDRIGAYQRHQPERTSVYPIVERHLSTLRDELQHHESSLPRFVLTEFQDYLRCGQLEYGFVKKSASVIIRMSWPALIGSSAFLCFELISCPPSCLAS